MKITFASDLILEGIISQKINQQETLENKICALGVQ